MGKKLIMALLVVSGAAGIYLIFTSDRFAIDPYSVIVSLIVAGFIIYLFFVYNRNRV